MRALEVCEQKRTDEQERAKGVQQRTQEALAVCSVSRLADQKKAELYIKQMDVEIEVLADELRVVRDEHCTMFDKHYELKHGMGITACGLQGPPGGEFF